MANYFISYDLFDPGQNYAAVEAAIESCGVASKLLYTVWYLSSSLTGDQILATVWKAMDSNDRLLVAEASRAWGQNLSDRWGLLDARWNATNAFV